MLFLNVFTFIQPIPVFPQLLIYSTFCVFIGSILSSKIQIMNHEAIRLQNMQSNDDIMNEKDAMMFMVYGSCVLYGIYMLYKMLPEYLISFSFTIYFTIIGQFCLVHLIKIIILNFDDEQLLQEQRKEASNQIFFQKKINVDIENKYSLKFIALYLIRMFDSNQQKDMIDIQITYYNLYIHIFTFISVSIPYLVYQNQLLNNIIGIAFSIVGIENMTISNFKIAFILLWGLFFYDIFWVYGTDVMLSVAKKLNAPIKLLFPYINKEGEKKESMLGLGDIVIPGVFVALCLKYDVDQQLQNIKGKNIIINFNFFKWSMIGYIIGILTTFMVLLIFNKPQPALLFLVPGVTIPVIIQAIKQKQVEQLQKYQEQNKKL